ncbi:MAG: hypothetical protein GXY62_04690 [Thermotogaceae bacterium]|jgi:uncharacterized repeat protein (TIGR01451 family)|nr:hypothetical protein [Thermotogaceae bacterium]
MKKIVLFIVSLVLAVSALGVTEEPVNVSIESYKIWDSQTATVTYEPLEEVFPGDEILYVLTYENLSDIDIEGLQMVAMIPEGTFYIKGSATGEKREHATWETTGLELLFSYDGGNVFAKPPLFVEEVKGGMTVKRLVNPMDYTNIMWICNARFKPSDILKVLYKVKVLS